MSLDFETAVESLQRTAQIPRDRAEQIIRTQAQSLGLALPPDPDAARDASVLEKAEQSEIAKLFRAFGCKVRNLSQPRATKQAPGIPDLYVMHRGYQLAWWWETKRQVGGRFSPDQVEFAEDCEICDVDYGAGDRHAAQEYLIKLGMAERTNLCTVEPVRR